MSRPAFIRTYPSAIGELQLVASDDYLLAILHPNQPVPRAIAEVQPAPQIHAILNLCCAQLDEYFAGARTTFTVPVDPLGTDFQKTVWAALCEIPYGQTCSYQSIANAIGNEKAVRAVGAANGRNPISIIIPCHRVVGKNASLTGYAGGLPTKEYLLNLEQKAPFTLSSEPPTL